MDKLRKISDPNMSPEEVDKILGEVIQSKYDAELRQRWENKLQESHGVSKRKRGSMINLWRKRTFYLISAAAAICLIFIAINVFSPFAESPQELALSYIENTEVFYDGVTKGIEEVGVDENRKLAIDAYHGKKYAEAVRYFSLIEEKNAQDIYFTGLAYLFIENYEAAIDQFSSIQTINDAERFKTGANWYQALALVLTNEEGRAGELLNTLQSKKWNKDQVQELTNALK